MKLPIPSLNKKQPKPEYYLALLLHDDKAKAVILQEVSGTLHIIDSQEQSFKKPIEEIDIEDWITSVDTAISTAEDKLPPDIETHKTVFGVKEAWTNETKIKDEYLEKLKKLGQALDLKPIGFIVISEAIVKLIEQEDGSPLSAILVEQGHESVTVTLLRAGKTQEIQKVAQKESLAGTVDEALKHFAEPTLPPRIILSVNDTDEKVSQEFITHHWSKTLPFLHVPQITVLPEGFDGRAVVAGAASQMGFEVPEGFLDKLSPDIASATTSESKDDKTLDAPVSEKPSAGGITDESFGFNQDNEPAGDADDKTETPNDEADNLGTPEKDNEEKPQTSTLRSDAPAFGFSTDGEPSEPEVATSHTENAAERENEEEVEKDRPRKSASSPLAFLSPLAGILKTPTKALANIQSLLKHSPLGKLFLLIPVILILLIVLIYFYFFKMHAQVTLFVKANTVSMTKQVTFSTSSDSDFGSDVIAATSETADIDGSVTTDATGSKEVGDKATGKVTIYNSSDRTRNIAKGTIIKSSNNLAFTLDDDASIASASGDIFSGTKSGTAQVGVTASDIGTDYNLPSNTIFTVSGDSSLAAKNGSAFSGGTKKTVTVVSQKDLSDLQDKLESSLEGKAKDVLGQKIQDGQVLFPDFIDKTISKTNFSKKVGDQANSVTLEGTVTYTGAAYKKDDLNQYGSSLLKSQYSNIAIADGSLEYTFDDTKKNDSDIVAHVTIHGGLLPKLDKEQLIMEIAGKSISDAKSLLSGKPQVESSNITVSPNIPLLPKLLPRQKDNITLTISAQD